MKFFKKLFALTLIFSLLVPVYANSEEVPEANPKEIAKLKEIFNISNEYEKFNFSTSNYDDKTKILNYSWSNKNGININISTDSKNNIISYSKYTDNEAIVSKIKTKSEIESIINSYLNKIDPNLLREYSLKDFDINIKSGYASFNYERYVNDTLVLNDYLNVTINLSSGELNSYSRNLVNVVDAKDFPKKENIISLDKAKDILKEKEGYYLSYFVTYGDDKKSIPVYAQLNSHKPIDATNGNLIEEDFNISPVYREDALASEEEAKLSPVEKEEINKIKNLIPISKYKEYIKEHFNTTDLKFSDYSLINLDDKYYYTISYSNQNDEDVLYFLFKADEIKLVEYNNYFVYEENTNSTLSKEEATKIALDFIKKEFKDLDKIDTKNPNVIVDKEATTVTFNRTANNYYVKNNSINIIINNLSKNIVNYRVNFQDVTFKPITEKVDITKAYNSAFKIGDFKLYYIYNENKPKLVYTFKNNTSPLLLAKNAEEIDDLGNPIKESKIIYNSNNSKYKKEIEYLKELNVGVPGVSDITTKIKEKDFLYLINSSLSSIPYNEKSIKNLYNYPGNFEVSKKDIPKMNNNTKNSLAIKLLVNASGYTKLNNLDNIFKDDLFKDQKTLSKEDKAYFAVAKGLKIYTSEKANPNQELTHEEALHLIYNFLN